MSDLECESNNKEIQERCLEIMSTTSTLRSKELIEQRKVVSDHKNNTDDLTFTHSKTNSSHGKAAKSVRERKDRLEIKALENQTNADYYNELELDELASIEKAWINE